MGSNPTPSAMTGDGHDAGDIAMMRLALVEAHAAEAHGDVPVGAVVVRDGTVIAARALGACGAAAPEAAR